MTEPNTGPMASPDIFDIEDDRHREGSISVFDLLILFFQQKLIILCITLAFAAVAVALAAFLPKSYTAIATVLPPARNSSLSELLATQMGGVAGGLGGLAVGGFGPKNPDGMYVAMLRSETVEDAVVSRYHLMQEFHQTSPITTRMILDGRVDIDGGGKDNLIHISVHDGDSSRAAELANGLVDEFRSLSEHLATNAAKRRRLFFERQLQFAGDKLVEAEQALKRTQEKSGLIEVNSQSRALIDSAAILEAQIASKEVEIQSIQTFATGQNPQLIEVKEELKGLQEHLAALGGVQTAADSLIVPGGTITAEDLEYERKMRNLKFCEELYLLIARQDELAKLDEAKEGALIQVVDRALPPDMSSSPKRGILIVVITFLGFWVALFFVYWRAMWQRWNSDPEFAIRLSSLRALILRKRRVA